MSSERVDLENLLENAFWLAPLARSLTRDAHAAEDALQDTWLTAAEKPPKSAAASRSWLEKVLRHRVYGKHRESTRRTRRESRVARPEASPTDEDLVERMEMQGLVADAVLALASPCRETIILRFYADLTPKEIAARQEISVHTVHTRLRRGLAALRGKLDATFGNRDAWFIALTAIAASAGSGSTASAGTIEHAGSLAPASSVTTIGTGVLMSLKSLGSVALLIVVGILILESSRSEPEPSGPAEPRNESVAVARGESVPPSRNPQPNSKVSTVAESNSSPPLAATAISDPVTLRGIVRAGVDPRETGEPLAAATIRIYPSLRTTLSEYIEDPKSTPLRWTEWGTVDMTTGLRLQGPDGEPPSVGSTIDVFDAGRPVGAPVAQALSGADGTFELPRPRLGCVVSISHPDYSTRTVVITKPDRQLDVTLWRPRDFTGFALDFDGEPIHQPLDLLFSGDKGSPVRCRTGPDGSFRVSIAAARVDVECLTPGWEVVSRSEERGPFESGSGLSLSFGLDTPSPVFLFAVAAPTLSVRNEEGDPICEFQLLFRRSQGDFIQGRGRFVTRDGTIEFGGPRTVRAMPIGLGQASPSFTLDVWAAGHFPAVVEVDRFPWTGNLEVVLEKGELPPLRGEVWDRLGAAIGAEVSLAAFHDIAWSADEHAVIARTKTDGYGRFELLVPEGRFLLQVRHEERVSLQIVSIPRETPVRIDFDNAGAIIATMRNTRGDLLPGHVVALHGNNGRQERLYASEDGTARFEQLPPGEYRIVAPHVSTEGSFIADVTVEITVTGTEQATADVVVRAVEEPIYPRVILEPARSLEGWTARDPADPGTRIPVEPDGTISVNVQIGVDSLEIESPTGQRFDFPIPTDVPRPCEFVVPVHGPSYRGMLKRGPAPLAGVRVVARPIRAGSPPASRWISKPISSAITDEKGRFELICFDEVAHTLTFNEKPDLQTWRREGEWLPLISFALTTAPTAAGTVIDLDLSPALGETRTWHGQLTRATESEGSPLSKAMVALLAEYSVRHGVLRRSSFGQADEIGEYSIRVAVAPRYRATIRHGQGRVHTEELTEAELPANGERDFVLPALED